MQDVVDKLSKPDELVGDLLYGTFATAKAYLDLPQHGRFVGCKVDFECFAASTQVLVLNVLTAIVLKMFLPGSNN